MVDQCPHNSIAMPAMTINANGEINSIVFSRTATFLSTVVFARVANLISLQCTLGCGPYSLTS